MSLDEIAAEKLRTLCQRMRETDLADLAMILMRGEHDAARVREMAVEKLKLVRGGNRQARIVSKVEAMAPTYDDAVSAVAPDAPGYRAASAVVLSELRSLLP